MCAPDRRAPNKRKGISTQKGKTEMISPSAITRQATPYDTSSTSGTSGSSNSTTPTASNELGPDSFITLLTAQLQAQDPTNPMDPNQMVDELTNMNTLQETIQVREDLDAL